MVESQVDSRFFFFFFMLSSIFRETWELHVIVHEGGLGGREWEIIIVHKGG